MMWAKLFGLYWVLNVAVVSSYNTRYDCSHPPLEAGMTIMGGLSYDSTDRVIQVFRNDEALSSGDTFDPGEVLTVSLSDTSGQQLLEASGGAEFVGGSCDGSSRFYGGSTNVVMSADNDVLLWGGWATTHEPVGVSGKFLLVSSGNPVTSSPTTVPIPAPSVTYSVSFQVIASGIVSTALQEEIEALRNVFCEHLLLDSSLCYITFISYSESTNQGLQFDLMVTDFLNEANASSAITSLQAYVSDSSSGGFIEEFFDATSLRFTHALYEASDITESSSDSSDAYAFSCSLSENLVLSWRVESQGDGQSLGEAGGYISGSLTMLSGGSTPWFSAGVVLNHALAMVESPEHVVYFYEPNSQQAGMFRIGGYSSSAIVADTRIRADTGVLGKYSSQTSTQIDFQQSRHTGIADDPVLFLDGEGDFNTIMWAHGGVWPAIHSSNHRGITTVYWLDGACVATGEEDPDTILWFFVELIVLLAIGVIVVQAVDKTSIKNWSVIFHLQRTLRQLLPSSIPLTDDLSSFTLLSTIAMAIFLSILVAFVTQTGDFYQDERGYDIDRAYSFSLGQAALLMAGLTVIPVNKTGIIVVLFGIPFDRATKFHRVCGGLTMLFVIIHGVLVADFWGRDEVITLDTSKQFGDAYPAYGFLAACFFGAMGLTAPFPIRSRCYELFQIVHSLFIPALIMVMLHVPEGARFLVFPLALFGLDAVYRIYQMCLPVENISITSPYSQYTILKVRAKHVENVEPGMYCLVNFSSVSLFQWHPISICSYSRETHELTFIIKNVGDWTAQMCDFVNNRSSEEYGLDKFTVRLIGPYGKIRFNLGPSADNTYQYEKIILIAGGIGCTPMISVLQWLVDKANDHGLKHRFHVTLLITARDREMFSLFTEYLGKFNSSGAFQKGGIDLRLYCTKRDNSESEKSNLELSTFRESATSGRSDADAPNSVSIRSGRPNIEKEIETVCENRDSPDGKVCVMVCGPAPIVAGVQKGCHAAIMKFGPVLDLHEESFRI